MPAFLLVAGAIALLASVPALLIRSGRGRLARTILARPGSRPALLTPADRCIGKFRRVPGVLGLTREAITFESRYEAVSELPLSRVKRIVSGNRMSTGRRLWRAEVLTLVDVDDRVHEFLMPRASLYQWRQHLGAWAARQKGASTPTPR